jgi:hypothetical protein
LLLQLFQMLNRLNLPQWLGVFSESLFMQKKPSPMWEGLQLGADPSASVNLEYICALTNLLRK